MKRWVISSKSKPKAPKVIVVCYRCGLPEGEDSTRHHTFCVAVMSEPNATLVRKEGIALLRRKLPLPVVTECMKCDQPAADEHTCPYRSEINGDYSPCNCCDQCTHNCALDI